MKPVKCKWDLVSVHWTDAFDGENGWTDIKEYKPFPRTVVTVGWLWKDCLEGHVTLVTSYFPDEIENMKTVGMPTHIPNGMVISQTVLKQASVVLPEAQVKELRVEQMLAAFSQRNQPSLEILQNVASPPTHLRE